MDHASQSKSSAIAIFYRSTVGKKMIMAVTGFILVGFVIVHMVSNLLVFQGPGKLDAYAAFLRSTGELLWLARGILLLAVILHIDAAWQLSRRSQASRPQDYKKRVPQVSTWGARTMRWGGVLLLLFIVFHLLHFTFGRVHPDYPGFHHATVTHNVMVGFTSLPVVIFYEVAMIALGLHFYHGIAAMVMSLGGNHPGYTPMLRKAATAIAILTALGFMSVPLAVYFGWIQ
ncbi:MAG TPA: succinate dehydrogenase cytochrome b subunit [Gemmatimonadales bacterium]|nr:succinate dehydrogenase cytochrome b subunit [Gemmatimonadales bacterium]